MKILKQISEDRVVAEFLKSEIDSERFGEEIEKELGNKSRSIITNPDLDDEKENKFRRNLLGKVRGFGKGKHLFENFPDDVKWFKAILEKGDLKKVKYIDHSYWDEISDGTRLPAKAAENIKDGVEAFGESNENFWEILSAIKKGKELPYMIFVAEDESPEMVILEGHARMTAYFLEPKVIPDELEVLLGISENITNWGLY